MGYRDPIKMLSLSSNFRKELGMLRRKELYVSPFAVLRSTSKKFSVLLFLFRIFCIFNYCKAFDLARTIRKLPFQIYFATDIKFDKFTGNFFIIAILEWKYRIVLYFKILYYHIKNVIVLVKG